MCWWWQDDSKSWHPYPPAICARLEAALAAKERSVDVDDMGERFVDVKKMQQARWDDPQRSRPVRRGGLELGGSGAGGFTPPPAYNPAASPTAPPTSELQSLQTRQTLRAKLLARISEKEATFQMLKQEGLRTQEVEREIAQLRVELAALG